MCVQCVRNQTQQLDSHLVFKMQATLHVRLRLVTVLKASSNSQMVHVLIVQCVRNQTHQQVSNLVHKTLPFSHAWQKLVIGVKVNSKIKMVIAVIVQNVKNQIHPQVILHALKTHPITHAWPLSAPLIRLGRLMVPVATAHHVRFSTQLKRSASKIHLPISNAWVMFVILQRKRFYLMVNVRNAQFTQNQTHSQLQVSLTVLKYQTTSNVWQQSVIGLNRW